MLLPSKGMIQWLRQKSLKWDTQYNVYLTWSYFISPMHKAFFPHLSPRLHRAGWRTGQRKNREKGKYCSFAHTSQKFVGIEMELLWGARRLRQDHCVYELLRLCISASSRKARKHLQIQNFIWKQFWWSVSMWQIPNARNSDFKGVCSVWGYYSLIRYNITSRFRTENFKQEQNTGINPIFPLRTEINMLICCVSSQHTQCHPLSLLYSSMRKGNYNPK